MHQCFTYPTRESPTPNDSNHGRRRLRARARHQSEDRSEPPLYLSPPGEWHARAESPSLLDPFKPHLQTRIVQQLLSSVCLLEENRRQGYAVAMTWLLPVHPRKAAFWTEVDQVSPDLRASLLECCNKITPGQVDSQARARGSLKSQGLRHSLWEFNKTGIPN